MYVLRAGTGTGNVAWLFLGVFSMIKGKLNSLAEYIWPATCLEDQRLLDSLVVSRVTLPVNMPAAAGLFPISIMSQESSDNCKTHEYA